MNDSVPPRQFCQQPFQSAAGPARDGKDAGQPTDTKWLAAEDPFPFLCQPDQQCSRKCCRGAILLTPYDVLRLKKRLGMQSSDFLRERAQICVDKQLPVPSLFLRPNDEDACRFLGDQGCTVYTDRPWACRLYPLGFAISKDPASGQGEQRYFLLPPQEGCAHVDAPTQTVRQWLDTQETEAYERWGAQFKELVLHERMKPENLSPMKTEMWFTACYDLDRFREFVFGSTLLQRFEVDDDLIEEMRYDDEELMRFAFQWLRFGVLGEQTMQPRTSAVEAYRARTSEKSQRPASPPE
jgi:uncharacterized protein